MAEDPPTEDEAAAENARQHVIAAVDAAIEAARGIADPDRAHAAAKELVETLRCATNAGGLLHAQSAQRIRELEDLSFGALGRRLGCSKSRAEQLCKRAVTATLAG